jgi:hypothetical protein
MNYVVFAWAQEKAMNLKMRTMTKQVFRNEWLFTVYQLARNKKGPCVLDKEPNCEVCESKGTVTPIVGNANLAGDFDLIDSLRHLIKQQDHDSFGLFMCDEHMKRYRNALEDEKKA